MTWHHGATLDQLIGRFGEVENATLVDAPPSTAEFTYELKYDGYRIVAFKLGKHVTLRSRRGQEWTAEFPELAEALAALAPRRLIVDGEVVALDDRGVPSFQRLQNRQRPLSYVVFDLLWLDGVDLRDQPIERRRDVLTCIMPGHGPTLALSSAVTGDAQQMLATACQAGFEGLVGKRVGSIYRPGRGLDWIKLKCQLRQEFAIVGYLPFTGTQIGVLGSLILALQQAGGLVFAGKVGTGFNDRSRRELGRMLEERHAPQARAAGIPRLGGIARWNEPGPVAEVRFSEWTSGSNIRHPSFLGLRPDKRPEDCVREGPAQVSGEAQAARARKRTTPKG